MTLLVGGVVVAVFGQIADSRRSIFSATVIRPSW